MNNHKHIWFIIEYATYFRKLKCGICGITKQWYDNEEWKCLEKMSI